MIRKISLILFLILLVLSNYTVSLNLVPYYVFSSLFLFPSLLFGLIYEKTFSFFSFLFILYLISYEANTRIGLCHKELFMCLGSKKISGYSDIPTSTDVAFNLGAEENNTLEPITVTENDVKD